MSTDHKVTRVLCPKCNVKNLAASASCYACGAPLVMQSEHRSDEGTGLCPRCQTAFTSDDRYCHSTPWFKVLQQPHRSPAGAGVESVPLIFSRQVVSPLELFDVPRPVLLQ